MRAAHLVRTFLVSLSLIAIALPQSGQALSLDRGPYLQMGTDSSMVIRWRTDQQTSSVVDYGLAPGALNETVTVAGSRTDHVVTVTGLLPDTQYFYSVGDGNVSLAGGDANHVFRTSPTPGSSRPTRIWILGDSGTANSNAEAVRDAYVNFTAGEETHLVLMLGDNAYSDGTDNEYQNAVFDMYPDVLRQVPLWSTLGNHDGHTADSATQTGPYYDIFTLPDAAQAGGLVSGTEAYYSFDYANVHFVCLESYETDRSVEGAMLTWLEEDLAATSQEWIIAFWHHPPYTKGSHNSDSESQLIQMRENALPILEDYGVDLVFTGHSHSYERSFLIDGHYGNSDSFGAQMQVDGGDGREDGTGAYSKIGGPGAPHQGAVYTVAGSSGQISGGSLDHEAMFLSISRLGSVVMDIDGSRIDVSFVASDDDIDDHYTVTKGPDLIAPVLNGASAEVATKVRAMFSERMDTATAEDSANYSLDTASVTAAVLLADNRTVELTTSALAQGALNTLTVSDVEDRAGNSVAPASQASFTFVATDTVDFQDGAFPDGTYSGTRDTYIAQADATANFGASSTLLVDGDDGGGNDLATLIAWDLTGVPAGATVQSASVTLSVFNPSNGPYQFYELKRDWIEGEATWNEYASGASWQAAGGSGENDRGPAALGALIAGTTGVFSYDLNAAGVTLVQDWLDGARPNYGIMIANSAPPDGADFFSSETGAAGSRPKLTVTVALPVDSDADGVPDNADNCLDVANPDQRDTNADGFGNICDADLDQSGVINFGDLGLMKTAFFATGDLDADLDGDGVVNFSDLALMKASFFGPPGPSGLVP